MIDEDREARIAWVATQRLGWVSCAAEWVYHRHNTSAILRTCDALGVHNVHLVGAGDHFRASRGIARGADRWLALHHHDRTEAAIAAIKDAGHALWVADFADPPVPPVEVPIDRPVCVWFGAEVLGVSDVARQAADGVVTVPLHGFAQSLNVSVAAALVLHVVTERVRKRHGAAALLPPAEQRDLLQAWLARELEGVERQAAADRAAALLAGHLRPVAAPPRPAEVQARATRDEDR